MQHYSKQPTQTQKFKTLQKLVLSYLNNIIHILLQLTDNEMLRLAFSGSAKLIPYIMSSRKAVKQYLKVRRLAGISSRVGLSHSFLEMFGAVVNWRR